MQQSSNYGTTENRLLYSTRKSMVPALNPLLVIFFWLIIPTLIIIYNMVKNYCYRIEFYTNYVMVREGWIARKETKFAFNGIVAVSLNQSVMGRLFNYGDVHVDVIGKWDVSTTAIKDPVSLKNFLQTQIRSANVNYFESV